MVCRRGARCICPQCLIKLTSNKYCLQAEWIEPFEIIPIIETEELGKVAAEFMCQKVLALSSMLCLTSLCSLDLTRTLFATAQGAVAEGRGEAQGGP